MYEQNKDEIEIIGKGVGAAVGSARSGGTHLYGGDGRVRKEFKIDLGYIVSLILAWAMRPCVKKIPVLSGQWWCTTLISTLRRQR